eukprot:1159307-Pelagomonas_calceolata.AAC.2
MLQGWSTRPALLTPSECVMDIILTVRCGLYNTSMVYVHVAAAAAGPAAVATAECLVMRDCFGLLSLLSAFHAGLLGAAGQPVRLEQDRLHPFRGLPCLCGLELLGESRGCYSR